MLRRQRATLIVTLATLAATIFLYIVMPKGFLPLQDTGLITAVTEAGDRCFLRRHAARCRRASKLSIRSDPDVSRRGLGDRRQPDQRHAQCRASVDQPAAARRPPRKRRATVIARLRNTVAGIPGMTVYFQATQDIQISTRNSRAQYQYTLVGTDPDELAEVGAETRGRELRAEPALREVASEAQEGGPRVMVEVDRAQAGRLGVSMQSVTDTLNDAYGQRQISTIYGAVQPVSRDPRGAAAVPAGSGFAVQDLSSPAPAPRPAPRRPSPTHATGSTNTNTTATPNTVTGSNQVPLSAFADFMNELGAAGDRAPGAVSRPLPSASIWRPATRLSDAVAVDPRGAERDRHAGDSVTGSYSGDAAEFAKSLAGEPWLILAAAIVIYIVLGVLYESFIHPLTILSTLPSAGVGALLALMLFGYDLSVIALIGIVLLMGIVKKNAILMIDFALEAERHRACRPRNRSSRRPCCASARS